MVDKDEDIKKGESEKGKDEKGISRLLDEYGITEVEEKDEIKQKKEKKQKKDEGERQPPRTPYVGGAPSLEDSGGWCLSESKIVTTIFDRRTGIKTISINGIEVTRR